MKTKEISREEFIKKYRELPLSEFLEELGVSPTTLYRILDKEGIERNRKHRPNTKVVLT